MNEVYLNVVFLFEVLGQMFGAIDGAMLPAGTAESHLEMREVTFKEALYMMVHQFIDALQERENLTILLQKVNDRLVAARERLVLLVFSRIMGRAAVEDISSAITGSVFRQPAFKRERVDCD